jgi:heme-degrading monooxygenase HmoA
MIVVLFATTLRDEALRDDYDELNRRTQELASAIPGFAGWQEFRTDDGETVGIVRFESDEALAAWRDDPVHQAVHQRGVDAVYGSYRVEILERVREAGFTYDG